MPQSVAMQEKLKKFEQTTSSNLNYNKHNDYEQNRSYDYYKQQNHYNDNNQEFLINGSNDEKTNQRIYSEYSNNKQAKRGLLDENRVCKNIFHN